MNPILKVFQSVGPLSERAGKDFDQIITYKTIPRNTELLERKYPGIINRCPLHYIGSYLGTNQVSISRIRAGIQ